MSAAHTPEDEDVSALDYIAGLAVQMVLAGSKKQAAGLCALSRIAGDEYAKLEGEANASIFHARRARIHQERANNRLRGRR